MADPALAIGAACTAWIVLLQGIVLARAYPAAYLDADLLSTLVYYRQLVTGSTEPFGYTVPKVLPIVLLGPLGAPELACALTLGVAAVGGAVVFLLAGRAFGLAAAVVAAGLYVLDPLRCVLTLRSSVDLYVGVALLAAMLALAERAVLTAGLLVLVAALGKPVAAPCGLAILLIDHAPGRRRAVAALLPWLALPATSALSAALDGNGWFGVGFALPTQHERFVRVAEGTARGAWGTLELIAVDWFGGTLFHRTWPLVLLGIAMAAWTALRGSDDAARRLRVMLLVPVLFATTYLLVAAREPLVVYTRFFWPVAAAAAILAAGAVTTLARRAPVPRSVRVAILATLVLALAADRLDDHRWRQQIMLAPFESHAEIAGVAVDAIAQRGDCAGPALVPLAYLPLAAWKAPEKLARGEICAVEDWADGRGCAEPNCVLFLPLAPTTERARRALSNLVSERFVVEIQDEHGALVRSIHG